MHYMDIVGRKWSEEIQIKTYDIDIASHVNNIVYLRWIEDLRIKLFSSIYPLESLLNRGLYPVVLHTEMRYSNQIKLFDKPLGEVSISKYCHGVIYLSIKISLDSGVAFTANQKCAIVCLADSKIFKGDLSELLK